MAGDCEAAKKNFREINLGVKVWIVNQPSYELIHREYRHLKVEGIIPASESTHVIAAVVEEAKRAKKENQKQFYSTCTDMVTLT